MKTIADAVVRYAEAQRSRDAVANESMIGVRLERIESAIETMSLEVERIGETHRFAAQTELKLPLPGASGRVITPH